jgi:hypothetical protein
MVDGTDKETLGRLGCDRPVLFSHVVHRRDLASTWATSDLCVFAFQLSQLYLYIDSGRRIRRWRRTDSQADSPVTARWLPARSAPR